MVPVDELQLVDTPHAVGVVLRAGPGGGDVRPCRPVVTRLHRHGIGEEGIQSDGKGASAAGHRPSAAGRLLCAVGAGSFFRGIEPLVLLCCAPGVEAMEGIAALHQVGQGRIGILVFTVSS